MHEYNLYTVRSNRCIWGIILEHQQSACNGLDPSYWVTCYAASDSQSMSEKTKLCIRNFACNWHPQFAHDQTHHTAYRNENIVHSNCKNSSFHCNSRSECCSPNFVWYSIWSDARVFELRSLLCVRLPLSPLRSRVARRPDALTSHSYYLSHRNYSAVSRRILLCEL